MSLARALYLNGSVGSIDSSEPVDVIDLFGVQHVVGSDNINREYPHPSSRAHSKNTVQAALCKTVTYGKRFKHGKKGLA